MDGGERGKVIWHFPLLFHDSIVSIREVDSLFVQLLDALGWLALLGAF